MMKQMKEEAIPVKVYEKLTDEEKIGKYKRGILRKVERIEYTEAYHNLVELLQSQSEDK